MTNKNPQYHHFRRINPHEGNIIGGGYSVQVLETEFDSHLFKINKCSPEDNYSKALGRRYNRENTVTTTVPNTSGNFINDLVDFCFQKYSEDRKVPEISDYHFRSFIREMCNPRSSVVVGPIRNFQTFMVTCMHAYHDYMKEENVQTTY